jgi:hypothetical protein
MVPEILGRIRRRKKVSIKQQTVRRGSVVYVGFLAFLYPTIYMGKKNRSFLLLIQLLFPLQPANNRKGDIDSPFILQ